MNSSELIEIISRPADSHGTQFLPARDALSIDRHITWWRWGKDDNPNSLVATITTQQAPDIGEEMVTLQFRPTSLIFTKSGQLLNSHTVSGRQNCFAFFRKDEPHRPHGLCDAIRPYTVFSVRQSPPSPAA